MPRRAVDYSKTVIYKIQHNEDETLLYVGSTTHFTNRKSHHKGACTNENDKAYNRKVYRMIRENGGWDSFSMIKIEDFPCKCGRDAEAREDELMRELSANMNMHRAFVENPATERLIYDRRYRETHQEQIQRYRETHREEQRQYRQAHREEHREYNRQYREANRDRLDAWGAHEVECEACNCHVMRKNLNRHRQTDKHNNNIVRLMEQGAAARANQ